MSMDHVDQQFGLPGTPAAPRREGRTLGCVPLSCIGRPCRSPVGNELRGVNLKLTWKLLHNVFFFQFCNVQYDTMYIRNT